MSFRMNFRKARWWRGSQGRWSARQFSDWLMVRSQAGVTQIKLIFSLWAFQHNDKFGIPKNLKHPAMMVIKVVEALMQIICIRISKSIYKEVEISSPWGVRWVVTGNCKMRSRKQMCSPLSLIALEKTNYNILKKISIKKNDQSKCDW